MTRWQSYKKEFCCFSAMRYFNSGVNFIYLLEIFLYKCHFGSFFYVHVTREKLPKQCSYEKFARKMLMKLSTDRFNSIAYQKFSNALPRNLNLIMSYYRYIFIGLTPDGNYDPIAYKQNLFFDEGQIN